MQYHAAKLRSHQDPPGTNNQVTKELGAHTNGCVLQLQYHQLRNKHAVGTSVDNRLPLAGAISPCWWRT